MKRVRTIEIKLTIKLRNFTREEREENGFEPGECPGVDDVDPAEIADLIAYTLDQDEVQDEMFAGSDVYVKIASVEAVSHDQ